MRRRKLLHLLFASVFTFSGTLLSCGLPSSNLIDDKGGEIEPPPEDEKVIEPEEVDESNPYRVDEYSHLYDEMEVSELESQYMDITYKDYSEYNVYGIRTTPAYGSPKFLVIPVWFTDSDSYILNRDEVRDDIETSFFGSEEETGWESVSTYYKKDSFNHVDIQGSVLDWYECGKASSTYYNDQSQTTSLFRSAYNHAYNSGVNLKDYDSDRDGFLDGLIIIYGAPDMYHLSGEVSNMWAYTTGLQTTKNLNKPNVAMIFWASYDFMYSNGNDAFSHTGLSKAGTGDTSHCNLDAHTYIHETGHMFGLDDYYDYSHLNNPGLSFSMQDYAIGGHDPFSRLALGWSKAYVPTTTSKITITPTELGGDLILLSANNDSYNNSAFNEYILLEFYSPLGLNRFDVVNQYSNSERGPNTYGIRMWHVDARIVTFTGSRARETNNIQFGNILLGNTNSTYVSGSNRAVNYLGSYDYNTLEVIRRGAGLYDKYGYPLPGDNRSSYLVDKDLFVTGDYFTTHNYRAQFVNGDELNSNKKLYWGIYFDEVTSENATITLVKQKASSVTE